MLEADHYKWEKRKVLIAMAVVTVISGALMVLLAKWGWPADLIAILSAVAGTVAILSWIKIDSQERGTEISGQFRLLIIFVAGFALIYYLFRSRGFTRGLKSTGWALLYFVGIYSLQTLVASVVMFTMLMFVGGYGNYRVTKSLNDGNEAFRAKKYDLAIAKYNEGIKADPEYVGSSPTLHANSGIARTQRAVETYNKGIKETDPNEKAKALKSCNKDLADSANDFVTAWKILKNAPATEIYDRNNYEATKLQTVRGANDTFQMAVRTQQVDQQVIDAAILLLPEYIALEPDPTKRSEANPILADLYRVTGDSEHAIDAYKTVLETQPNSLDALAGAGLSLVNLGYLNNDQSKLLEGATYLKKYIELAPDGHKFKADALTVLDTLKTQNKGGVARGRIK